MKKKILIAEDDDAILEVMTIVLEEAGYVVFKAQNISEIKQRLNTEKPDMLLLDIWLSGENGEQIAKELKETSNLPIVMVSANSDVMQIAKKVNAAGYLQKPFELEQLLRVVKKHIA